MLEKTYTQRDAISRIVNSPAHNFCLYGSSRSGKSVIIAYAVIVRACKCRSNHIIARNTFASAKASLWQGTLPNTLRMAFPELAVKYNHSDHIITFPNKSTIRIVGLDDNEKVERLLGLEASTLWFNEANQIPYPAITKLKTRLAEKNDLKKISFYDFNPTHKQSWMYQLFEQKIDPVGGEMLANPADFDSFHMNIQGNLGNVDTEYVKMLEHLPEKERLRFLLGQYDDESGGNAVYAFRRDEHVDECAVRQPGTVIIASDFNIDYNSDILCSRTANNLYVWDEIQLAGDTYKKCAALIEKGARGGDLISDSTGKNRSTKGISDHEILRQAGFNVVPTLNPYVKDKIANLNRCFTLGIIKINPCCKKLIRDLTQLVWDKNGQLDQKTDPSLSHLVDCLAYVCWKLYPLIETPKSTSRAL